MATLQRQCPARTIPLKYLVLSSVYCLRHDLFAARMLSTMFGYGRPAFLAIAFADDFWLGDSGFDLPSDFGRGLSQIGLLMAFLMMPMIRYPRRC